MLPKMIAVTTVVRKSMSAVLAASERFLAVPLPAAACAFIITVFAGSLEGQPACLSASDAGPIFQMSLIREQRDQFIFEVDATPMKSKMSGAVNLGTGHYGAFGDGAITVRFNPNGTVDMQDGGVYRADRSVFYTGGETYHVKVVGDVHLNRYTASIHSIKAPAESAVVIGQDYTFRHKNVERINLWGIFADVGQLTACNGVVYPAVTPTARNLWFNGVNTYIEAHDGGASDITTSGQLTVAARIRPHALAQPHCESSGYVHILGRGQGYGPVEGQQQWLFRMYCEGNTENRGNRISFYVFNREGGKGNGSYFQDPLTPGKWIDVVGVVDGQRTFIFKDGIMRDCDKYVASASGTCDPPFVEIAPSRVSAPLRVGTEDFNSYFQGSISSVRIWNRALTPSEITALHNGSVPKAGLVGEYLLDNDVVQGTAGAPNAVLYNGTWQ